MQEVHEFLCGVACSSAVHSPHSVAKLAQLCFSLLSTQQVKIVLELDYAALHISSFQSSTPQHVEDQLFDFFTGWLEAAVPATELLYLLAMLKPSHDIPQVCPQRRGHCRTCSTVFIVCVQAVCLCVTSMAVESSVQLDVRRAALYYLTALCGR